MLTPPQGRFVEWFVNRCYVFLEFDKDHRLAGSECPPKNEDGQTDRQTDPLKHVSKHGLKALNMFLVVFKRHLNQFQRFA